MVSALMMGTSEFDAGGNLVIDWHSIQGEIEILLVTSCYGHWDMLQPDEALCLFADLTLPD